MKTYLLAILVALSSITAFAQEQFGRNAPVQQVVRVTDDGKLEMLILASTCYPVLKTERYKVQVPVQENGKTVLKTEEKTRAVTEMVTQTTLLPFPLDLNHIKAFETDGRAVDVRTLTKRIKEPTLVVTPDDGKMIAPYYAAVFKPGTLIIARQMGGVVIPLPSTTANEATPSPIRLVSQAPNPGPAGAPADTPPTSKKLDIKTPRSLPPMLVFGRVAVPGKINLRHYSEAAVEREVSAETVQAGVSKTVLLKQLQKFTRSEATQLGLTEVKAMTGDAKPLTSQALSEKLKTATVVMVSSMGQAVDPFWLQNVKPDVVVLTGPPNLTFGGAIGYTPQPPAPAAPVAVPAPASAPPAPIPQPVTPTPK